MEREEVIKRRKIQKKKRKLVIRRTIIIAALVLVVGLIISLLVNLFADDKDKPSANETSSSIEIEENVNSEVLEDKDATNENDEITSDDNNSNEAGDEVDNKEDEIATENIPTTNIDKSAWNLILVNPWNKLPEDFSVELTTLDSGYKVDSRIVDDLNDMFRDARAAGLDPIICSSYRAVDRQKQLFKNQIDKYLAMGYSQKQAEEEAAKWVAIPGTSEHHTGLALDIVARSYQMLDDTQENTAEQKWLMGNSYKYGFILRYPKTKGEITGIVYEPWHYRYVGKDIAKEIYEKKICLEEYLNT